MLEKGITGRWGSGLDIPNTKAGPREGRFRQVSLDILNTKAGPREGRFRQVSLDIYR
jgi:hypothetical protein